jgi:uncharacterized DUF497 family protein
VEIEPDWTYGEQHMMESHGVTVAEATEALTDIDRVAIDPDPASRSGQSVRVIGWSHTRAHLVTVILVRDGDKLWGANGWDSNTTDSRRYRQEEES